MSWSRLLSMFGETDGIRSDGHMSICRRARKREAIHSRSPRVLLVLLALATQACAEPSAPERILSRRHHDSPPPPGIHSEDVHDPSVAVRVERTLNVIPYDQLWHRPSSIQARDYLQDSAGVPLYEWEGTVTYHPVVIEWKAIAFL